MKKLLLILPFLCLATTGWSQCSASFVDTLWGDSIFFFNTSDTASGIVYYWYFPGGTPSADTTTNINTYTMTSYANAGTYTACLVLVNSNLSCTDTFCQNNTITNPPVYLNTNGSNTPCGSCNGSATANASGGATPYSYLWSNGATTQTANGLCAGTYGVTVTDNNGTTAQDFQTISAYGGTVAVNITLSDTAPCPGDTVTIIASASGGTAPYTYLWNTGENTNTVFHNTSGLVMVTATDAAGCNAVDSVFVDFNYGFQLSVTETDESCLACCDGTATASTSGGSGSGFTYAWNTSATTVSINNLCPGYYAVTATDIGTGCSVEDGSNIDSFYCQDLNVLLPQGGPARIYLIQESGGVLTAIDSLDNDSTGTYYFWDVCPGTYVKAALLPTHPQYANYLPTYYDSVALWTNATATPATTNTVTVYIDMIPGNNPGGPGFVGGLVSLGANRSEGDPVVNVQVILFDNDDKVVAFTKTDASGEYGFDNIPLGSYKVHVDILNKISNAFEVTITSENPEAYDRNFIVTGNQVKPAAPTGITHVANAALEIYPNPTTGNLIIRQKEEPVRSITVFNLVGEQVFQMSGINEKDIIQVDLGDLASGQYIIELKGEQSTYHQTVVVD